MEDPPAMADLGSSSLDVIFDAEKDPDPASLEAAMQAPITVVLGPTGPLLRKLHGQSLPPDLLSPDKLRLLTVLCISLKDMSEGEVDAGFMARWWMKIVRELCYDTEDRLDKVIGGGGGPGAHHDFSAQLARAKVVCERRKRFAWSPPKTIKPADRGESLGLPVPICGRSTVGVHVDLPEQLVELLALDDEEKTLKVIPICGCAGVGKTLVARTLYQQHARKFQCRAFVTVSRNPYMRGFLTSMLSQLKAPCLHGFPDVQDLLDAISKHLQGKRYFIVIDDLWTASVWNIISRAFPLGNSCSRIITTTQIDDIALACCSYYSKCIYKMELLNDIESRKLFFGRAFGSEDGCPEDMESRKLFFGRVFGSEDGYPEDIEEVSSKIIRKCGGLPLAIVNIASLLANESKTVMEKWKCVHDSLPVQSVNLSVVMKDVLNLVYISLPPRLRTCLLYLSMYAHGYVIKKDELVKLWITEGFLRVLKGQDIEELAEGYFDELVRRGMVQAMDTNCNGKVLSCSVHQIVLDFIRHKSREENFVISVDYKQSSLALPDKVRRLSVQFGGVKGAYIPESIVTSHVRSLIFWGFFKCIPPIMDYGFLRVMILHIWADQEKESFDLTGIGKLLLLKYLKIESNTTIKLPDKIQGLQHLETLQVDARLSDVPSDLDCLRRMLYLSLPSEADMPNGIWDITSLCTLGYFDLSNNPASHVGKLGDLTNLRDLHLTCAKLRTYNLENNIKRLGSILRKLICSLKCLTLAPADSSHINTLADSGASSMGICFDGLRLKLGDRQLEDRHRRRAVQRPKLGHSEGSRSPALQSRKLELGHREVSHPPALQRPELGHGEVALQRLELSRHCCFFSRLPDWIGHLVNICVLKVTVVGLSGEDIDVLKGLSALAALTLYIQTAPAGKIVIKEEGFEVLTYFKFMCAAPCLSFVPGAMPKVQKLKLGFNLNKKRSESDSIIEAACFHHLTGLTEISVKFGTRGADELRIKTEESALEDAVRSLPNTPTIRVQCVDVIFCAEEDRTMVTEEPEEKRQEIEEDKENITELSEESRYPRTDRVLTALMQHAQSVDLVTGASNTLLDILHKLLDLLKPGVKNLVDSLYKELEALQAALHMVAKLEQDRELETDQRDEVLNAWAKDVRDLSYDAEEIVDSFVESSEPEKNLNDSNESRRLMLRTSALLSRGKGIHDISHAIDDIMTKADDLAARRERYKVSFHIAANPNAAATFDPPLSPLYKYPKDMVGINVPMDEVISMLIDETDVFKKLKIVSILGIGGLGKTTLLKAMYDKIRGQYKYTAFVSVSRDPDIRKILMEILLQIHKHGYMIPNLAECDEEQLFNEVWVLLANKRYLIIFDDICDVKLWERIKRTLVDSGRGSRVVTSTELLDVAKTTGEVYELKALSGEQSKKLFDARFFYGEKKVPNNLPEVSEKLLLKCGGVPLAIITMASLLVRKPVNDWSKVYNNIGFGSEVGGSTDATDSTREILLCTYNDLPYHLRACLLHLHIFPMNCIIKKETLIWMWAAEGLIVEEPGTGRGLFELGEGYFQELINRNLVIPVEDDLHPGKVIGCHHVHDLVLDMISSLSTEENIVTVLDGSKQQTPVESKARRLSIQKWAGEQGDPLANVHPERLRSFNTMGCRFSAELSLSRFKLLRVLALEECTLFEGSLSHLGKLLLLRYLGLYNTPINNKKLPEEIGGLIYLQTLDLRGTKVTELPGAVAQLSRLKCLRADEKTSVPDWIGNLTSLEELWLGDVGSFGELLGEELLGGVKWSENFVIELGKLTELRELHIWIKGLDDRRKEALVKSMGKLEKIQVLRIGGPWWSSASKLNWKVFDPPVQLRELYLLSIPSYQLPAWINVSRVPTLSYLSVYVDKVEDQDLDILGALPELISLVLRTPWRAFLSIKGDGAFPKLRFFHKFAQSRFLPGAMPRLETLRFQIDAQALKDHNIDFDDYFAASTLKNLLSLQKVEVGIRSATTDEFKAMQEAVKRGVDQHPNSPIPHVVNTGHTSTFKGRD